MFRVFKRRHNDSDPNLRPDTALPAVKKIKSIRYGLLGDKMIGKFACVHIADHRMEKSKAPELTSVYSPLLGTTERGMPCVTCKKGMAEDEGHFGMMELAIPKYRQEWLDDVLRVLRCTCFGCGSFKGHLDPKKTKQILKQCKSDAKKRLQALSIHCAKLTKCEMKDSRKSKLQQTDVPEDDPELEDILPELEDMLHTDTNIDTDLGDMVDDMGEDTDGSLEEDAVDDRPDDRPDERIDDHMGDQVGDDMTDDDHLARELLDQDDEEDQVKKTEKKKGARATTATAATTTAKESAGSTRVTDVTEMKKIIDQWTQSSRSCCGTVQPSFQLGIGWIMATFTVPFDPSRKKKCFPRFHPGVVRRVLQSISDEDAVIMGMDPKWSRPEDMMWSKFLVPPTTIRPSMKSAESGKSKGHDDLTMKLVDIVYYNNELRKKMTEAGGSKTDELEGSVPNMYAEYRWLLKNGLTVTCTCKHPTVCECVDKDGRATSSSNIDPSAQRSSPQRSQPFRSNTKMSSIQELDTELQLQINAYTTGDMKMLNSKSSGAGNMPTKQIKSLRARLVGKHGRLRGNIMGRRQNFSARTVIVPDARLDLDEISFPESFASILTYSERVTQLNIQRLNKLLRRGSIQYVQKADGRLFGIKYAKHQHIQLQVGDIVQRKLQNGDIVLFNRQPSLHAPSIQAMRIRICKQKVFGMNPCATGPFNADFDGDEMNIWVLQDELTRAEAMELITTQNYMVWTQSASAIISAKQNPVAGLFYLTSKDTFLNRDQVNQILTQFGDMRDPTTESRHFERWKLDFPEPAILKPVPMWSGKQVMSMFLPCDYFHGEVPDSLSKDDTQVLIRDNELLVGQLTDALLGGKPGAFIHRMFRDYSPAIALRFLSGIHRVANWCLELFGLTTSVSDISVLETTHQRDAVDCMIAKTLYWCDQASLLQICPGKEQPIAPLQYKGEVFHFPNVPGFLNESERERFIVMMLDKLRDLVGRHVVKASRDVSSHQIVGLWDMIRSGSKGKEIHMTQLIGCLGQQKLFGLRICMSSPHFSGSMSISESKGFVPNPFMHGLSATAFFFHAIGGREGLVDTAQKTAQTGYLQRCLIKFMENLKIEYDGTVRDSSGHILEYRYGHQGWDPTHLERVTSRALSASTLDQLRQKLSYTGENGENGANEIWSRLCFIRRLAVQSMTTIRRNTIDTSIFCPVPFERLLANACNKMKKTNDPSLTIDELTHAHRQLWDRLCKTFPLIFQSRTWPVQAIDQSINDICVWKPFELLYRDWCLPHYLANLHINRTTWTWIEEQIMRYVAISIAPAGEMVGAKSGQCIGEVGTQATLRTFHFAGMASNVVLGFPRFKEIVYAKKPKKHQSSPIMSIVLKPGITWNECRLFCDRLKHESLGAFLNRYDVVDVPEDQEDTYASEWSPVKLVFSIRKDTCRQAELDMGHIVDALTAYLADYLKLEVDDMLDQHYVKIRLEPDWCVSVQFHSMRCAFVSSFMRQTNMMSNSAIHQAMIPLQIRQFWLATCERFSRDIIVKGIPGVESATIANNNEPEKIVIWNDATESYTTQTQYRIETTGSNLREVLILPEVDKRHTTCNNMFEIYDLYGTEATRVWLIENFVQLLNDIGAFVMYPHLNLLTRTMMRLGRISGIKRNDIHSQEESILKVMMFENPMEYVKDGALFAVRNLVKGVTDSIVVNSRGPMGTGAVNLVTDPNKRCEPVSLLDPVSSWTRAEPLFDFAQHASTVSLFMSKVRLSRDTCVATSTYDIDPKVRDARDSRESRESRKRRNDTRHERDGRRENYPYKRHKSEQNASPAMILDDTFGLDDTSRDKDTPLDPIRPKTSADVPMYGATADVAPTYAPGSPVYIPLSPSQDQPIYNPYDGMDESLMVQSFSDPALESSSYKQAINFLAPLQHLLTPTSTQDQSLVFRPCSPLPEWLQSSHCIGCDS